MGNFHIKQDIILGNWNLFVDVNIQTSNRRFSKGHVFTDNYSYEDARSRLLYFEELIKEGRWTIMPEDLDKEIKNAIRVNHGVGMSAVDLTKAVMVYLKGKANPATVLNLAHEYLEMGK